jgi:hypothetical protein
MTVSLLIALLRTNEAEFISREDYQLCLKWMRPKDVKKRSQRD